jgi:peptidoglycan/xylan/chitin deacetylase (PgdA/CDA1 family)
MKYYLTFDGSPHPNTVNNLDVLKKYDVKATFFVEGHRVSGEAEILKRIVEEGHALGNHTFSHELMEEMSWEEILAEILLCEEKIFRYTGVRSRLIRPPWGKINEDSLKKLEDMGYEMVLWNTSVRDWEVDDADVLSERLISCARDGVIPVLHDRVENGPGALNKAIPILLARGFKFDKLDSEKPEKL